MQQIAVGAVQFEGIEAQPLGALRGRHECIAHALKPQRIERERRQFAVLVRHHGGSFGLPAAVREGDLLAAIPWRMARSLAAGVGELHRHRDSGMLAHRGQDRL